MLAVWNPFQRACGQGQSSKMRHELASSWYSIFEVFGEAAPGCGDQYALCASVGGIVLERVVDDQALSKKMLRANREAFESWPRESEADAGGGVTQTLVALIKVS